ncbi:hypothetical protein, partial [Halobellus salinus]
KKNVLVVDPDDYRKTQKLKAIQEAKDRYREYTLNRSERFRELDDTWGNPQEAMEHEEAQALAMYGSELLPLIEEGIEKGAVSESDLEVETNSMVERLLDKPTMDIREVVRLEGRIVANGEHQAIPRRFQKRIYRQLERIERKLGLGLDLEEDKGPANI